MAKARLAREVEYKENRDQVKIVQEGPVGKKGSIFFKKNLHMYLHVHLQDGERLRQAWARTAAVVAVAAG